MFWGLIIGVLGFQWKDFASIIGGLKAADMKAADMKAMDMAEKCCRSSLTSLPERAVDGCTSMTWM